MSPHPIRQIALVGIAESDLGKVPHKTAIQLAAEASRAAPEDAGLRKSDVDGLFTFGFGRMGAVQFGEYLQIQPRYSDPSIRRSTGPPRSISPRSPSRPADGPSSIPWP